LTPENLKPADLNVDLQHDVPTWRARWNLPEASAELTVTDFGHFICVEVVDYERGKVLAHGDIKRD
jgi:hypothetical protein